MGLIPDIKMTIYNHYVKEKQRFLENCLQCGLCAQACPILPHTDSSKDTYQQIQEQVFHFIDKGLFSKQAYTKAFSCMECFKCANGVCPEDLNPMLINELIKQEYIGQGLENSFFNDPGRWDSAQRVMANIQVSESEYTKITSSYGQPDAPYVFFPGCNVYFQPEKLLNALDIMDAIGDDYSFLPGLDYCCSDSHLFFGAVKEGGKKAEELITALSEFNPKTVILWCPTCHCRFKTTISPSMKIPFKVISFPQYLAENMHKLQLTDAAAGTVTLHDACKSAYTSVDINGPRDVLKQLPGVELVEMAHCGHNTMCCGSGAMTWFPDSCKHIRKQRLDEAMNTGADRLVTICHYCSQTFVTEEPAYDFSVDNYVNLVALAMGIHRKDKFKQYTLWADREMIVKDAQARIASSPFAKKRILDVLGSLF